MTPVTKIQRKLTQKRIALGKVRGEITDLVAELQGICDHADTRIYRWEHDNGYGRQSWIEGTECVFCGWLDLWNRGRFTDPKDIRFYCD